MSDGYSREDYRATVWVKDGNAPGRIPELLSGCEYTTVGNVGDGIWGICFYYVEFVDDETMAELKALVRPLLACLCAYAGVRVMLTKRRLVSC